MALARWDPSRGLIRLRDEDWDLEQRESTLAPKMDLKEVDKKIIARMDIPGMKMEDINVSVNKDTVTISGERKMEKEEKNEDFVRVERSYGSFCRSFYLGVPIKEKDIKATYKDGVLEVVLPKAEASKAKKIKIEAGK